MLLSGAIASQGEMRGLWVVRTGLVSPESVDRVVDQAHRGGLNTLFVQVRGRGDAFYSSQIVPRSDLLRNQPESFDPLARLLARAKSRGLQVHAWINVLLSGNFSGHLPPRHVLTRHPDWAMFPRQGARQAKDSPAGGELARVRASRGPDVEGYYLSPAAPGVADHLEGVVRELLSSYDLDGLHFDYIRYPGRDYDYSLSALSGFGRVLEKGGDLLALPTKHPFAWDEYRRQTLTDLLGRLGQAARSERPGIVLSAAVIPDETRAVQTTYQSWPRWAEEGRLDAICPMAYTTDGGLFRSQVGRAQARVGTRCAVWAGVGAYRLTLPGIVEQVRAARDLGSSGVILFSHESLSQGEVDRLREEVFGTGVRQGLAGGILVRSAPSR